MAFKDADAHFQLIDVSFISPDPTCARRNRDETGLRNLANSISRLGVIHPLLVQPANAQGMHTLIVGERRWRAAVMAGEKFIPVLIRACESAEVLDVQVSENMGAGVRSALEPRDMACAIQTISTRFENKDAAAEHFGGTHAWLKQATAAANLSPGISALLDSGKISSASTAIQLEKLVQKNEAKAKILIGELPEGEKLSRKRVDKALAEEGGRRKKALPVSQDSAQGSAANQPVTADNRRINAGKVRRVAQLLGIPDGDESEILIRLVDEFLAYKDDNPPF